MQADKQATERGGLVVVDKPAGMTSHDVVARVRRLAGTRRVGHAGTLDPMATGVLVVGVGKATRLLGYLTLTEKQYLATIRLGQATSTDDAEGTVTSVASTRGVTAEAVLAGVAGLTGEIQQVPPAVSAIKVGGKRSYKLAREGAAPVLAPRPVTVWSMQVLDMRAEGDLLDVDVDVRCSSGTYIRALARDLGAALEVGGHLTRLRRTAVGPYDLRAARDLDQLADDLSVVALEDAAAAAFPSRQLSVDEARAVSHGGRLPGTGRETGPVAAFGPDGTLLALVEDVSGEARPLAVFVP
ncbi:MAG TPA: tRNA pseudouridine(55) synthase TruB [Streptosporangiaceae bacterium]|nr:tRNA pseudouridine(55) synthase TruB [Streptosporangiaceae bacterium]